MKRSPAIRMCPTRFPAFGTEIGRRISRRTVPTIRKMLVDNEVFSSIRAVLGAAFLSSGGATRRSLFSVSAFELRRPESPDPRHQMDSRSSTLASTQMSFHLPLSAEVLPCPGIQGLESGTAQVSR